MSGDSESTLRFGILNAGRQRGGQGKAFQEKAHHNAYISLTLFAFVCGARLHQPQTCPRHGRFAGEGHEKGSSGKWEVMERDGGEKERDDGRSGGKGWRDPNVPSARKVRTKTRASLYTRKGARGSGR
jgi:hypothetical protein